MRRAVQAITMQGYSDKINHALAFAAKYHDQQVRRGTRPPYFTQPANVGVILTRYACDDATVIAGILLDVVGEYVLAGLTREMLDQRVGDKFGAAVLEIALSVAPRRTDDTGVELLSIAERRNDQLARVARCSDPARWVIAAHTLHTAATLLADLKRTVDPGSVWSRYATGRDATVDWYRRLRNALREAGFEAPIVAELSDVVDQLEQALR